MKDMLDGKEIVKELEDTPCIHVFITSDMLCYKCGLYFPETNNEEEK